MAIVDLGSQKGDRPSTPTLRQYHKKHGTTPAKSFVATIFLPNKLPYYTIITDHDFKVVVQEDNPLHGIITDSIESWSKSGDRLVVSVEDGERGYWGLGIDTDMSCEWEQYHWGWKLTTTKKTSPKKNRSPKGEHSTSKPAQDILLDGEKRAQKEAILAPSDEF